MMKETIEISCDDFNCHFSESFYNMNKSEALLLAVQKGWVIRENYINQSIDYICPKCSKI